MDRFGVRRAEQALFGLRVVVSVFLVVHGVARISLGIVHDFGEFLTAQGLPLGLVAAWSITLFEVVGGLLLASGVWVRALAVLFIVELATGIVLVHWPDGWFVVGAGRNGMEYSVLLLIVLAGVAYSTPVDRPES